MEIKGVGPKVADCVLLFGLGFKEAFPIDVWIKRVISKYYGEDFTPEYFGKYAGIAQQFLFYNERYIVQ
jgi:N-glycosylase/DNA lyase